ncbi:MAG: metallophosphoesterase [Gemmatimonadetes bacterium]|nr:metallophosphoesterase [Gemmatimonadota bacterium]
MIENERETARIFALSDVHVDSALNLAWMNSLSESDFQRDVLILAGDVSDRMDRLERTLAGVRSRFADVFFVPGNHELWVRRAGLPRGSLGKFDQVLSLCDRVDVRTRPGRVGSRKGVWIVPLFSWYLKPEEGPDSLFTPKAGEDETLSMWSDDHFVRWPETARPPAEFFLDANERNLSGTYEAPVISFSHFLPRRELIFGIPAPLRWGKSPGDPHPAFNFSRVAGCRGLDAQIRRLGSTIHVYGHQHRNRFREIEGVTYVSHCLGYPRERENGHIRGLDGEPRLIWDAAGPAGDPGKSRGESGEK